MHHGNPSASGGSSLQSRSVSQARRILFAATPALTLVLLLAFAAELLLRARFERIEQITGVAAWSLAEYGDLQYHWDLYDSDYGWTNLPGYRSEAGAPFRLSISSQGLRASRDYALTPAEGTLRIAVFGDSCTFGEEVDDDETFPYYLERLLRGAVVLNFGVHGFGLGQMMLRLEREGLAYQPDHVVIVLMIPWGLQRMGEDFFVHSKPVFGLNGDGGLEIGNHPVPESSQLPWLYRNSFVAAWAFARHGSRGEPESLNDAVATAETILERTLRKLTERGIGLTLVPIVVPGELDAIEADPRREETIDRIQRELGRLSASLELDLLNEAPMLRRAYEARPEQLRKPLGHWSALGNCLIAKPIARRLANLYPELELDSAQADCR